MYIDAQQIILFGGVVGAIATIMGFLFSAVKWLKRQDEQDEEIEMLKKHHDEDMNKLIEKENAELSDIKSELQLLTFGVLACLKSIRDMNDPQDERVCDAINKIEKHLNERAHD